MLLLVVSTILAVMLCVFLFRHFLCPYWSDDNVEEETGDAPVYRDDQYYVVHPQTVRECSEGHLDRWRE